METFQLIIFVIFANIIFIALFFKVLMLFKNLFSPLETTEAEILKIDTTRANQIRNGRINITPVYEVTFLLPDKTNKKFDISSLQYKWVEVGDIGILTIQGTSFVNFKIEQIYD
jgi:uncharacterized protein YpmB